MRHPEFQYSIADTNKGTWIYIEDPCDTGWGKDVFDWTSDDSDTGPIELLLRIKDRTHWNLEEIGDRQYRFKEDSLGLIFQWDDLFGFVVIIQNNEHYQSAVSFLEKYFNYIEHI